MLCFSLGCRGFSIASVVGWWEGSSRPRGLERLDRFLGPADRLSNTSGGSRWLTLAPSDTKVETCWNISHLGCNFVNLPLTLFIIVQYHWGLDFQDWLGVVFLVSVHVMCASMLSCYPIHIMASCFQHVSSMFGMMLARLTSMSLREKCVRWKWPSLSVVIRINHKQPPCSHLCWVAEPRRLYNDFGREPPWCIKCEAGRSRFWLPLIMLIFDLTCHSRRTPDTPIFNPLCNPFRHSFYLCFTCDAAAKVNGLIPWAVWSRFPGQPNKPSLLLGST